MIMFGGSPQTVAVPPRLEQKTSAKIIGTGLNFNNCESSTVTAARNRITVILAMNIERNADRIIKVIRIGTILYRTSFAISMQSHVKKPARFIPSTMTIIPAIKIMVAQLIPLESSDACPTVCQKLVVKMLLTFNTSMIACPLCRQIPRTKMMVSNPQPSVIR